CAAGSEADAVLEAVGVESDANIERDAEVVVAVVEINVLVAVFLLALDFVMDSRRDFELRDGLRGFFVGQRDPDAHAMSARRQARDVRDGRESKAAGDG